MTTRIGLLTLCLAAAAAGFCWFRMTPSPPNSGNDGAGGRPAKTVTASCMETDFHRELSAEIKTARERLGLSTLNTDPRLEEWLSSHGRQVSGANLEKVMASVEIPGFRSIRATHVNGGSLRELSRTLGKVLSDPATSATDNCIAFHIRSASGQGHEVLCLTGEALPELTLAGLNDDSSEVFVSRCPHCRKQSSLVRVKSSCGLIVDCPNCGLRCQFLAPDTNGRYHDATTFLIPSACPDLAPGTHPLDAMLKLWQTAVLRCRYAADTTPGGAPADFWQIPGQTLRRGAGDCEDSALLLTDWLLTSGISARMAMGQMDGGGHAWCIARVEGTDYLLESTDRNPDMEILPAVNPGDGYEPDTLMDRDALYVRAQPAKPFDGDYWSPAKWIKLPRVKPARAPKTAAAQRR